MPRNRKSPHPEEQAFSREVRLARRIAGITQEEAGQVAGIDRTHVGWVEQGHGCTLRTAVRLARAFGISLDALFGLGDAA